MIRIINSIFVGVFFCLLVTNTSFAVSDTFPPFKEALSYASYFSNGQPNHTYYCAPSGSNETGNGSLANPWYDLIGAGTGGIGIPIQPGDLLLFRGGSYRGYAVTNFSYSQNRLQRDASAALPIVISNYPGEQAVWNYTDHWALTLDGDYQALVGTKVGLDYGIRIIGGITVRANNCTVSGVEFINGASNGGDLNPAMLSVPLRDGVNNLHIINNYFHDSKLAASSGNRMSAIKLFVTTNTIVEYNLFKDNLVFENGASVCFKDMTSNAVVRYNKFINCLYGVYFFIQGDIHNGLDVYQNLFYDVNNVIRFENELGPNIKIHDNVALTIPSTGAFMYYLNADDATFAQHGEYYNNIIEGKVFIKGWHTNSSDPKNIPDYFDYNLWKLSLDRNFPSPRANYYLHDQIYSTGEFASLISYDSNKYICTVADNYPYRTSGRFADIIGGFIFGFNPYDLNADGVVNVQDVTICVNMVLAGTKNIADLMAVVNEALK